MMAGRGGGRLSAHNGGGRDPRLLLTAHNVHDGGWLLAAHKVHGHAMLAMMQKAEYRDNKACASCRCSCGGAAGADGCQGVCSKVFGASALQLYSCARQMLHLPHFTALVCTSGWGVMKPCWRTAQQKVIESLEGRVGGACGCLASGRSCCYTCRGPNWSHTFTLDASWGSHLVCWPRVHLRAYSHIQQQAWPYIPICAPHQAVGTLGAGILHMSPSLNTGIGILAGEGGLGQGCGVGSQTPLA